MPSIHNLPPAGSANTTDEFPATQAGTTARKVTLAQMITAIFANVGANIVAVINGGTGSGTAAGARTNLGAAASGANTDITSLASLSTPLSVGQGGTGVTTSTGSGATVRGTAPTITSPTVDSLNGGQLAGMRNRLINGAMKVDQRNAGAAQTITAAAALAYTVDRFYAYCTGANVTGQQVAGTAPNQFNYRFTGAASVTKIGFSQRIEANNSFDLAGQTATFSVDLANSLLTTVTWTAWYANTTDTFGTLASPTRTLITSGTFTVNSTIARYSTQIAIPAAATTGVEIELSVGAQTSGTWTIGRTQLELGSQATPFEVRLHGAELSLCLRYMVTLGGNFSGQAFAVNLSGHTVPIPAMRASPTLNTTSGWALTTAGGGTNACTPSIGAFSATALYVSTTDPSNGLAAGNATLLTAPVGAYVSVEL